MPFAPLRFARYYKNGGIPSMGLRIILTGDINLMGVEDPAVPFSLLQKEFQAADIVFGNLETCLYDAPGGQPHKNPAFFAPAGPAGEALKRGAIQAVGIANNVNFGESAVRASISRLDELGIPHTGAGENLALAGAPVVLERKGLRAGFLQRTSVYWAANHEARDDAPGVAVIRGHTAYEVPLNRDVKPMNRPGVAPIIMTWANPDYLDRFRKDMQDLCAKSDISIASFHWGVGDDVLQYMKEIAHAAVDSGAHAVMGHGPHDHLLAVELYKGRPIFYGLGALSFFIGHTGRKRGWAGMIVKLEFSGKRLDAATFQFVRQADDMRVTPCRLDQEASLLEHVRRKSAPFGTTFTVRGDEVIVGLE